MAIQTWQGPIPVVEPHSHLPRIAQAKRKLQGLTRGQHSGFRRLPLSWPIMSVLHPPSLFRCTQNGDGVRFHRLLSAMSGRLQCKRAVAASNRQAHRELPKFADTWPSAVAADADCSAIQLRGRVRIEVYRGCAAEHGPSQLQAERRLEQESMADKDLRRLQLRRRRMSGEVRERNF